MRKFGSQRISRIFRAVCVPAIDEYRICTRSQHGFCTSQSYSSGAASYNNPK
jgi:hypothetical protein